MAPLPPMERLRLLIIDHESRFGPRAANISKEEANKRDADINELLAKYNLKKNYYNVNKRSATRTIRNREKKNQCPPTETKTENEAPETGKKQLKPPQKVVKSKKLAGRPRNAIAPDSSTTTTTTATSDSESDKSNIKTGRILTPIEQSSSLGNQSRLNESAVSTSTTTTTSSSSTGPSGFAKGAKKMLADRYLADRYLAEGNIVNNMLADVHKKSKKVKKEKKQKKEKKN